MNRYVLFTVTISSVFLSFISAYAGHERPLVTENAEITPVGVMEMRLGLEYLNDETLMFQPVGKNWNVARLPVWGCSIGLGDRVEVQADFDALYLQDGHFDGYDVGDLRLWTKVKLLSEQEKMPAVAVKFGMKLPNAGEQHNFGTDESDNFGLFLISKHFGDLESRINLGMGILGSPISLSNQDDVFLYGIGLVKPVNSSVNLVAEINGIAFSHAGNERSSFRAGIQIPQKSVTWDIAGSMGLNKASENWGVTAGATWTFQAFRK